MEYQLIESLLPQKKDCTAVERVLTNRGILDIDHYLNTTDKDILDPKLIKNITDGAKMLIKHIAKEDNVLMIIDCDADGYTSSALLLNYLNRKFPGFVQNNIIYEIHDGKQHGIEEKFIEDALNKNCKLIICADSSSNDYKQHEFLFNNGIDVLVIDHHEAEKISEYACIINNQLCDYPTKSLSGVGMVYKFCSYLDELIGDYQADNFLDLVALGIIADMMDLRDYETKHLISKGLEQIKNPFFSQMVKNQGYSIDRAGGLNPFAISFYIAPMVNATIRMGTKEEKILLFESMLDFKAYEPIPSTKRGCKGQKEALVEQACRNCVNIKNRQTKARDASLAKIETIIEDKNLLNNKILVIKLGPDADRNITGLIANQIMAKYKHPVLLLSKTITPEGKDAWEGSGRGFETKGFDNLREFLRESGYAFLAEGHANALGVGIFDTDFNSFIEYSNNKLKDCDFAPCYKVDFIWDFFNFKPIDVIELAELNNLWGQGIEQPKIVLEKVQITKDNLSLMSPDRNPTLKIQLPNGTSLIKFKSSQEEYESLKAPDMGAITINIVGTCAINEWNGKISPQIIIEDYEVVGQQAYYF